MRPTSSDRPRSSTAPVVTAVLAVMRASVAPTATSGCSRTSRTSSSMPIDVKKTPLNSARNGSTSESACRPYSDSEMIRPARKAPIASEKAHPGRHERGGDGEEADAEREQLAVAQEDDAVERPADDGPPPDDERRDHRQPAGDPQPQTAARRLAPPGQERHQEHEGDDAEVLEQQDRHRLATGGRVELRPVGVGPRHHRGRRHRGEKAVEEGSAGGRPERGAHQHHERDHAGRLRAAGHQHRAAPAQHLGERQLEADGEQEQHDADLREGGDGVRVRNQTGARRPDDHPGQQERDEGRQPDPVRQGHDGNGEPRR